MTTWNERFPMNVVKASDEFGEYYEYNGRKFRRAGSYWEEYPNGSIKFITVYKPDMPKQSARPSKWLQEYYHIPEDKELDA